MSGHYERSAALPQGLHLLAPLAPQSGCVIDETVDEGLEVLNFESDAAPNVDRWEGASADELVDRGACDAEHMGGLVGGDQEGPRVARCPPLNGADDGLIGRTNGSFRLRSTGWVSRRRRAPE